MITIGELAAWIMLNRTGNAFKDYSLTTIINEIDDAINENSLVCSHNGKEIVGVVVGQKDDVLKVMHIHDILTTRPHIITEMMKWFKEHYPDYSLTATRKGKHVMYNSDKLLNRLSYGTKL